MSSAPGHKKNAASSRKLAPVVPMFALIRAFGSDFGAYFRTTFLPDFGPLAGAPTVQS